MISDFSAFSKTSLNIWKFTIHILLKPDLKNFEHYLLACEMPGWKKHKLVKVARRNINNLRYADDATLMAESEEELKAS